MTTLFLTLIALLPRLFQLGTERFWYDEAFSAWAALPTTDLWPVITGDTHPPLWYLVQRLNVSLFGLSEFSFRLPSALFGAGCVLLVWRIALRLGFERRTALVAGLLAAFLPGAIFYSQDARMYSLLSFAVLLAVYAALRRNWYIFVPAALAACYTQNVGCFYVSVIGLLSFATSRGNVERAKVAVAGSLVMLGYLPWVTVLLRQMQVVGGGWWVPPLTPASALWPVAHLTFAGQLPALLHFPVYGLAFVWTGIGLLNARRWLSTMYGRFYLVALFGAPLMLALLSLVWTSIYVERALLPSALLLCIVWAYPLVHLGALNRRVALAVTLPTLALCLLIYYPTDQRGDRAQWLQPIHDGWQAGDVVYHTNPTTQVVDGLYLDKPAIVRPGLENVIEITAQVRHAFGFHEATFDQLPALGYRRAWVVVNRSPFTSAGELAALERFLQNADLILRTPTGDLMTNEIWRVDLK